MLWRQPVRPEIEAALVQVPIFAELSPRDIRRLSEMCHLKLYAAGETILEQGSTGLGLFVLVYGRVEVFKHPEDVPPDGGHMEDRAVSLAVLEDGDVLGEIALLDDQPRSASAVALTETQCLLLSRERFPRPARGSPEHRLADRAGARLAHPGPAATPARRREPLGRSP